MLESKCDSEDKYFDVNCTFNRQNIPNFSPDISHPRKLHKKFQSAKKQRNSRRLCEFSKTPRGGAVRRSNLD